MPSRNSASVGGGSSLKLDRKSTRLNSSHSQISYAVFCLKKKKTAPRRNQGPRRLASRGTAAGSLVTSSSLARSAVDPAAAHYAMTPPSGNYLYLPLLPDT